MTTKNNNDMTLPGIFLIVFPRRRHFIFTVFLLYRHEVRVRLKIKTRVIVLLRH